MKSIKIYLIIVSSLLLLAIAALIYVWYVYQNVQPALTPTPPSSAEHITDTGEVKEDNAVTSSTKESISGGVTIDTQNLTEAQRSILASFGYKGDTVTIPREVISCAEQSVGAQRFTEILDGSAPTPFELLKLSPCLKK